MIKFLKRCPDITHISLDHDLGDAEKKGTGYDVLFWIEKKVATSDYTPPEISIHTSNPSARKKMNMALGSIQRLINKRND